MNGSSTGIAMCGMAVDLTALRTSGYGTFEKYGAFPSYDRLASNNGTAGLRRLLFITFRTELQDDRYGNC